VILVAVFLPLSAKASDVPQWQINQNQSSISFTATQNNAPVSGQFKRFSGDIHFNADQLPDSHIDIIVEMDSINVSYKELLETLKTADWFNIKRFPHAEFKSKEIIKLADQSYQAKGDLTIRDKTQPFTITFNIDNQKADTLHIKGSTIIHRTFFGIGQGDWASTDEIKDDVQVKFDLTLTRL